MLTPVVVAHKDRMCRFAFEFVQELANSVGCEIIVANQESLSPQQELVEDLMSIIHCFSCRLYGLRNYSKEIKENRKKAINKPIQDLRYLDKKEIQC
jgi:putative resolvase